MDDAIARYAIVVYPPGKVYNYANLDYGIVEQMIAHTSGESYESYMRRAVFAPLGMPRTAIGTGRGLTNGEVAHIVADVLRAAGYRLKADLSGPLEPGEAEHVVLDVSETSRAFDVPVPSAEAVREAIAAAVASHLAVV